ncbi:Wzz/FepE/Etk N-terminal domain-containing protein [Polynucleobacter sp. JS-JIR-II-c23]|uniref:Wzz/FepE/Etk N-terminal domain-containing protein n=1 Tax=Polynucleobacter sp. JS-JIR-II-c23 TaxID=1758393 RepID=UPI002B23B522|nr:Wzz/FepE/Etk N-terminal domain-containing protein [Polynucleobacter sp. JS-JIR-II-c23]MEA9604645.1 Wzz/FepE/Etk N-terminal domain-containing protein [Polynucleobacter sp. JS-JIR-II-c23]
MQHSYLQEDGQKISLLEIVDFIKKSWKIIGLSSFLGLICAVSYIVVTPPMFEATAQIRMAQISQVNPSNPFGTAVEDPFSLISRMQFPTNYSPKVIGDCGYQDQPQAALALSKGAKFSIPKGVTNTVELKILAPSPDLAASCAQAIFVQISQMQERLSKVFVEEAESKLASDNEHIEGARKLIAKADQSGSAMSAAYLSARDELTYFLTDREKMVDLIKSVKSRGTRLDSPIYVSERPVSPKKTMSLAAGLVVGFSLGILFALGRKFLQQSNLAKGSK